MKHNPPVRNVVRNLHAGGAGVVIVKIPGGHGAILAHAARNLDDTRRAEVPPGEFFLTRPRDFDRLAGGLGQASSLNRIFTRMLFAVRSTGSPISTETR